MRRKVVEQPKPGYPLLARFAESARDACPPLGLKVDRASGLLWAAGDSMPFVERLLHEWQGLGSDKASVAQAWGMVTQLTENREPADPDLVRGSLETSTTVTKADEPSDPDLIRPVGVAVLLAGSTVITRHAPEDPDPDLVRPSGGR